MDVFFGLKIGIFISFFAVIFFSLLFLSVISIILNEKFFFNFSNPFLFFYSFLLPFSTILTQSSAIMLHHHYPFKTWTCIRVPGKNIWPFGWKKIKIPNHHHYHKHSNIINWNLAKKWFAIVFGPMKTTAKPSPPNTMAETHRCRAVSNRCWFPFYFKKMENSRVRILIIHRIFFILIILIGGSRWFRTWISQYLYTSR